MTAKKRPSVDPLFQMFEHFLVNRSYDDSAAFTKQLAEQYVAYLDSTPAHLPFHTRAHVLQDLEAEAHEMLVKKMYGCVKASDYTNFGRVMTICSGFEVAELDFTLPSASEGNPPAKR